MQYNGFTASNNFTGTIPTEFGQLATLDWLFLNNLQLSGPIPAEIGGMVGLSRLNLGERNTINGSIPPEIGQMSSLLYADLGQLNLSGSIPAEIGQLAALRTLGLCTCLYCFNELWLHSD